MQSDQARAVAGRNLFDIGDGRGGGRGKIRRNKMFLTWTRPRRLTAFMSHPLSPPISTSSGCSNAVTSVTVEVIRGAEVSTD
jgi:hypothetical protein